MHEKRRHPRVLADRPFLARGHVDVGGDNAQRLRGLRCRRFLSDCEAHRLAHIRRKIRRGLCNQLEQAFVEKLHKLDSNLRAAAAKPAKGIRSAKARFAPATYRPSTAPRPPPEPTRSGRF